MMNIGETIQQRYRLDSLLGQGSMGATYKAFDKNTQRPVAVKVLHFSRMQEWKVLELFEREAKVLQRLSHPRIPKYIDYFSFKTSTEVRFVLVQEYIEGKTLQQVVEEGWRGTEPETLNMFQQLVEILEYLHAFNPPVIHRDINPKNIILDVDKNVYLVDFGAVQDSLRTTFLSGSTIAGTFGYMPFEQFSGQTVPASDYYALGATLLYLLTHRHPSEFPMEGLKLHFHSYLQASPAVMHLLNGLLEPVMENRLASPEEIKKHLRNGSEKLRLQLSLTEKPYGSKIRKIFKGENRIHFQLPDKGWNGVFQADFSELWGALGKTILELTPEWVSIRYTFLGIGYSRRLPTAALKYQNMSEQQNQGIMLQAGAETVKFGIDLTLAEQEWLKQEIEAYIAIYAKPVATDSEKPYHSKIKKRIKEDGHVCYHIPPHKMKWIPPGICGLCFVGLAIFSWMLGLPTSEIDASLSIIWMIGVYMFVSSAIGTVKTLSHTSLDLTPEQIIRRYSFLGVNYSQQIPTTLLDNVESAPQNPQSDRPAHDIILYAGAHRLTFGSHLSLAEQEWMRREIQEYIGTRVKSLSKPPEKPYSSKITKIIRKNNRVCFRIPRKIAWGIPVWWGLSVFWLAFLGWICLVRTPVEGFPEISIPFWFMGGIGFFGIIPAMGKMLSRTHLKLTTKRVKIRHSLLGLGYSRRLPTASINTVDTFTRTLRNGQKVDEIALHADAKSLKFGSHLTPAEREWLVQEIKGYLAKYGRDENDKA